MLSVPHIIAVAFCSLIIVLLLGVCLYRTCGAICGYCYCNVQFIKCETCKFKKERTPIYPSSQIDP